MSEPKLNRKWVVDNLRETIEHIESAIEGVEAGREFALECWIPFIYLDLNRAWNGRYLRDIATEGGDNALAQFPKDVDLSLPD